MVGYPCLKTSAEGKYSILRLRGVALCLKKFELYKGSSGRHKELCVPCWELV
ncbi:hypothetical protein ACRRTK_007947 [Alexandromys fortis]